ncbi:hypothetical protein VTH82DRAFT_1755 [Thermothelomyces myriococcoides]
MPERSDGEDTQRRLLEEYLTPESIQEFSPFPYDTLNDFFGAADPLQELEGYDTLGGQDDISSPVLASYTSQDDAITDYMGYYNTTFTTEQDHHLPLDLEPIPQERHFLDQGLSVLASNCYISTPIYQGGSWTPMDDRSLQGPEY